MDNETVMEFLKKQMDSLAEITKNLSLMNTNSGQNVPKPLPLDVEKGNIGENYEHFVKSFQDYVIATGMNKWPPSEEEKKIRILFTLIGDKAMFKYDRFKLSDDEKTTVNNVISAIRSRLISKRNVIYERAMFNSCNQETDEKFDDYYRKLEKLIENCEFKDFKSDLLRDRIVLGIKNKELRKRLMIKADLTLRETLDLCRIDELTNQQMQELSTETVNKISNARSCKFCGNLHSFTKGACPAFGQVCRSCGGKNHFQKVCKKKKGKKEQIEAKVEKKSRRKKIKSVEGIETGESDEENETYDICKIIDNSNIGGKVEAILDFKINKAWKKLSCQLDTGANVNLIGYNYLCRIFNTGEFKIKKSQHKLYSFGGGVIPVLGQCNLCCKVKDKKFDLQLQVVNVEHGVLLSASACVSMGLINYCNTIMERNLKDEAQSIITKYKNVFEGYGCFGNEARLETSPEVKPVLQYPRRIPLALRPELEKELHRLEESGIIAKQVTHTDWVSNLLLVRKKDSFRICLDPIPLNKALERPNYQFQTIDEMLPELGNAKIFSLVDTKKGFWQIKLDYTSSLLTTFWTPLGRYRWLRLPFGIKSAPEIFQINMNNLVRDLKGVKVLADDILIYGCGSDKQEAMKDHNKNLENLLYRLNENKCKLNTEKLRLCVNEIKFYGHVLTDNGIKPDQSKLDAIQKLTKPKNKEELLRFLGMLNYLSRYIKDLSSKVIHLRKLTHQNIE